MKQCSVSQPRPVISASASLIPAWIFSAVMPGGSAGSEKSTVAGSRPTNRTRFICHPPKARSDQTRRDSARPPKYDSRRARLIKTMLFAGFEPVKRAARFFVLQLLQRPTEPRASQVGARLYNLAPVTGYRAHETSRNRSSRLDRDRT